MDENPDQIIEEEPSENEALEDSFEQEIVEPARYANGPISNIATN